MKCKHCEHYKYEKELYMYPNSPSFSSGICTYFDDDSGHRVFEFDKECEHFYPQENEFCEGDTFQNDTEILFIENINERFYPKKYRVRNNYNTVYSMTAEELIACKLIVRGRKE